MSNKLTPAQQLNDLQMLATNDIAHEIVLHVASLGLDLSAKMIQGYIAFLDATNENLELAEQLKKDVQGIEGTLGFSQLSSKFAKDTLGNKKIWNQSCESKLQEMEGKIEEALRPKVENEQLTVASNDVTPLRTKRSPSGGARKKHRKMNNSAASNRVSKHFHLANIIF